jgi:transketolase
MVDKNSTQNLQDVANILRIHSLKMTDESNSGHPTSCASMAELISVLFFHPSGMHFNPKDPRNPANDVFVLSKGHASPIYYAAWAEAGTFPKEDLLNLRKVTSDLEGHPTPRLNFCDFATGSLGQGLANTVGCAYSSKYFDSNPNKYFCIIGDGEAAEGSIWEAANFAGIYKLDNLIAILDCNRLGQSDVTAFAHETSVYESRFKSFGFNVIVVDGHNIQEIIDAYTTARNHTGTPTCIVAKTFKGKGFEGIEDKLNFHGKPMKSKVLIENLEKILVNKNPEFTVTLPTNKFTYDGCSKEQRYNLSLNYENNKKYSTREGFGFAFKKLGELDGKRTYVVGLDGDVKNSTFTEPFYKEFPHKFVNCFIAEQLMVSVSAGVGKRNKIPFCSTFSTFFTRAFDQIRMGAISQDNVKYIGTHSGCHIGEDGPSQMGLEDLALFRSVPGMVVLAPTDVVSAERATQIAANHYGSVFVRLGRNTHDILYKTDEVFEIGKSKVLLKSDSDVISVISYGPPIYESLKAAEVLKKDGINVRIIDLFSIKPIDVEGLSKNISETNNTAFVIEDHYYEGGAGEAVCSNLSEFGFKIHRHAVDRVPRSGKPEELYDLFGLSAEKIVDHLRKILKK